MYSASHDFAFPTQYGELATSLPRKGYENGQSVLNVYTELSANWRFDLWREMRFVTVTKAVNQLTLGDGSASKR
jgi:hypothetical protein